ncbi:MULTISPECIES: HEPN domain-containing protein [Acinetobacter]|uniref:HEPN domain-containing protein n=1 Tax=Acinetobacter TaxID=469 RepID=UPI000DD064EF|nr:MULTISPECIES: HEPN domain-containing protein [Acinetobacter]MDH1707198.1 HEPN domain-containing protein [Acinetobacter johnsonii]
MSSKVLDRFEQLITEAKQIATKKQSSTTTRMSRTTTREYFDEVTNEHYLSWKVKTENLLKISCGEDSVHYQAFLREKDNGLSFPSRLRNSIPVVLAAYDDLKNGFLISFKQIVQAEVFDSELEQAKSLLESGYKNSSAVIAGVVLETAIKELCLNHGIELDRKKLTHLNDELAKAGVYNKLQQKQITALADIRNNAAHGDYDQFTKEDVIRMIQDIERFILNFSS